MRSGKSRTQRTLGSAQARLRSNLPQLAFCCCTKKGKFHFQIPLENICLTCRSPGALRQFISFLPTHQAYLYPATPVRHGNDITCLVSRLATTLTWYATSPCSILMEPNSPITTLATSC